MRIDADAHVIETEETWEYMEGADRKFMPRMVAPSQESSPDEYWLIDERVHIRSVNVGRDTPAASRELRDVAVRLKHMDELGVDVQVLYPTIFLMPVTARAEVEVALCRGYNRREFSGATLLSDSRIYVGVENNDDLPYVIDNAGDDNLVIGSDYGHADSATELMALERFGADSRLASTTVEKILDHNPKVLYGI